MRRRPTWRRGPSNTVSAAAHRNGEWGISLITTINWSQPMRAFEGVPKTFKLTTTKTDKNWTKVANSYVDTLFEISSRQVIEPVSSICCITESLFLFCYLTDSSKEIQYKQEVLSTWQLTIARCLCCWNHYAGTCWESKSIYTLTYRL